MPWRRPTTAAPCDRAASAHGASSASGGTSRSGTWNRSITPANPPIAEGEVRVSNTASSTGRLRGSSRSSAARASPGARPESTNTCLPPGRVTSVAGNPASPITSNLTPESVDPRWTNAMTTEIDRNNGGASANNGTAAPSAAGALTAASGRLIPERGRRSNARAARPA